VRSAGKADDTDDLEKRRRQRAKERQQKDAEQIKLIEKLLADLEPFLSAEDVAKLKNRLEICKMTYDPDYKDEKETGLRDEPKPVAHRRLDFQGNARPRYKDSCELDIWHREGGSFGMNIRGVCGRSGIMLLLAVALLGSGAVARVATAEPVIHRGALPSLAIQGGNAGMRVGPTLAAAFVTSSPSPPLSVATGAPSPVLRQMGPQEWETTVLVDDDNPACSDVTPVAAAGDRLTRSDRPLVAAVPAVSEEPYRFWLAGGKGPEMPGETVAVEGEQTGSPTTGTTLSLATGSSCEVTVAFTGPGLRQVPETAMLVLDQAGASSAIPLTVSRDVTLFYYLGIPAIVGGVMTLLLLMVSLLIRVYGWDGQRLRPFSRDWRERPVLGSGAWALNDSWMTNVSTGLVVVGTIVSTASAANSLFPGLALDRFAIVNIVAAAIVVAAPVIFGIKYAMFTAANPGPTADSTFEVTAGRFARIDVPSGASITTSGDATVTGNEGNQAMVRSGCTYQVPAGATIEVRAGTQAVQPTAIAVAVETVGSEAEAVQEAEAVAEAVLEAVQPTAIVGFARTSDIGVGPGTTLAIRRPVGTWTIQAGDQLIPLPPRKPVDVHIQYPMHIDVPDGAKITVTGTADVTFPPETVITAPRRQKYFLKRERYFLVPQGTNVLVGNMGMILAANFFTMFGIGAELGIAVVLAYFSEATQPWRVVMFCAIAAVAILVFTYAKTATRTMADPQPGSSLSSQAGTSFTL
jgi:hypothetical protein